jgi:hypothetical protein
MTTDQRLARAIQRATEQRAHVLSIPGRPGFYQVRSATDAAEWYTVSARGGRVECSCKAAEHGFPCWHAVKVEGRLIRESRKEVAA